MNKILKVKCPHCEKEFQYYQSEFRPFCSEKCKMVDLGHWLQETYKVPVKGNIQENYDEETEINNEENEEDFH